ncbi:MAG: ADP-ribosylglycohydrolase family protein [Pseudomonadales bacterium]|nr:ADP-ribosylglycohydrolase family protein [Pseudomonadales bacterium]
MSLIPQTYQDKIQGVLFGQAIGDALGLGTEFLTKNKIKLYYPNGLNDYKQIIDSPHTRRWQKGEWTDDTNMMLCILESLLANQGLAVEDIAQRWKNWAKEDGRGIGQLTIRMIANKQFVNDAIDIAKRDWQKTGANNAPNGGVMRTSAVGLWQHWNLSQVANYAEVICSMTHADPRCIESARIISLAIARLINGELATNIFDDLQHGVSDEAKLFFDKVASDDISLLDLDGSQSNNIDPMYGYTFKAMGAGLWASVNARNFEEGLLSVIHEGGDADTNAAVAGAVLGARFGISAIPEKWIVGLVHQKRLLKQAELLIKNNFSVMEANQMIDNLNLG